MLDIRSAHLSDCGLDPEITQPQRRPTLMSTPFSAPVFVSSVRKLNTTVTIGVTHLSPEESIIVRGNAYAHTDRRIRVSNSPRPTTEATIEPGWQLRPGLAIVAVAVLSFGGTLTTVNDLERRGEPSGRPATVKLMTTDAQLPKPDTAAHPNQIHDDLGRFSFTAPPGWVRSGSQKLTYGTTLLSNPDLPDGVILLGPVDLKFFASSYPSHPDNSKCAIRLASDMGTFLMPYPGNRINWDTQIFSVDGLPAATSYFETKYEDPHREDSQLWVAVAGHDVNRFFALWRGIASSPIDRSSAQALAESIEPD